MKKNNPPNYYSLLIVGDFIFLTMIFLSILYSNYTGIGLSIEAFFYIAISYFKEYLIGLTCWFVISGYTKIYNKVIPIVTFNFLKRIFVQFALFSLIILSLSNGENSFINFPVTQIITILTIVLTFLTCSRIIFAKTLIKKAQKGLNLRNAIIIGLNDNTNDLVNNISQNKVYNYKICHLFSDSESFNLQNISTSSLSKLKEFICQNKVEYAFISLGSEVNENEIKKIVDLLENKYIEFGLVPNTNLETEQNLTVTYLDTFPILTYKKYPLDNSFNQIAKRTFDIVFTLFTFIFLLSWLMPIITIAVLITQGRPIFFAQKRNGLNGKEFDCLKFRSMVQHKHNSIKPTERNDPRVTKLGKILRKTSLDELPQFINVLKGEMSIVGPRPHMVSENESYSDIIQKYSLRHYVKPGITGLAQTKGYRGAIDSNLDMEKRIRADIYYVRNWSFLLDIFIIYKTVKLMIFGDENAI